MTQRPTATVHFGGPDQPRGALRDLLEQHVDDVPSGGEIDWATYYFRDRRLAAALVRARARGVRVRLVVEGTPRQRHANVSVLAALRGESGLAGDLRELRPPSLVNRAIPFPHLHAKIYAFSHPTPHVLVGSFNPSGDVPEEDPALVAEIGDQDRGHNLLVEHHDPAIVDGLRDYTRHLARTRWRLGMRYTPRWQRVLNSEGVRAWFFPRIAIRPHEVLIRKVGRGGRIRVAMSHFKLGFGGAALAKAAKRGVRVAIIVHETQRRAPQATLDALLAAGAQLHRYRHSESLPMHAKFMLLEGGGSGTCSTYGSLNFNARSLLSNHEVFVADDRPEIFAALDERWALLEAECRAQRESA